MVLVTFKSKKVYFDKEKSDVKNNTARYFTQEELEKDERFVNLARYARGELKKLVYEGICPETQEKFRRKIRDVSFYKGLAIITWDEKRKEGGKKRDGKT